MTRRCRIKVRHLLALLLAVSAMPVADAQASFVLFADLPSNQ